MTNKDKLDALISASLLEEEPLPPTLQATVIRTIRSSTNREKAEWHMPWWLPSTIGGAQTAAFIAAVKLLMPDSLFAYVSMLAGAGLIACAVVLSIIARKRWRGKEREHICGG